MRNIHTNSMDPIIDPQAAPASAPADDGAIQFPTGEEVYDSIMGGIEPELISVNIPHLDEQYANETEEEKSARYERYTQAFAKYDEAYAKWEAELNTLVTNYRHEALSSAEAQSKQEDAGALSQLEESFA